MMQVVDQLPRTDLGEGPWWDAKEQNLFIVDLLVGTIHRLNPQTGKHDTIETGMTVGFAVLDQNDDVIAGLKDGIYRLQFGATQKELLARPQTQPLESHFNDGKCDRQGRIWTGTRIPISRQRIGSLYRLNPKGQLWEIMNQIRTSNGMGWSPDDKTMYYTDTQTGKIACFDYNVKTATPSKGPRVFATIPPEQGRPDGLTVDSQGRVYSAIFTGGCINVYTSDGKLDEVIVVPAPKVTSIAFGGKDLKTLFITTAAHDLSKEELHKYPLSGRTFAVERKVPGLPEARFNNRIGAAAKRPSAKSLRNPLCMDL
ncbi:MAG: SMP-30/gluconolactonase/LRE family protein [Alphaproteobacteria bacterium]